MIEIDNNLVNLSKYYNKKIKRQRSFSPIKTADNKNGIIKSAIIIGNPGRYLAITLTLMILIGISLSIYIESIFIWLFYIIIFFFLLKFSYKMDKSIQIRALALSLIDEAVKKLINYNKTFERKELIDAKELLLKVLNYIEEPSVRRQLKLIKEIEKPQ
ncbi:MAG: hypothetical protein SVN78_07905 [Deferribacterota bacterium]|nr:hypothetical protein [Deferribacterota bacterium]